ncbi:osmosensor SHO1 Ecym_7134 [Eremothecium cymbalariae DBVPG|uniref:High osmolarity signaling protein SHO1 n=1 Tax=Eremothecium cymbalariae (strain CBS 270.75 / DBVPG 7215 / KCTC 17166 / NRRL Y-17582) TaxID=931890 RepID=G8JVW9_ERECY|nr:hypothetical protein Ecym_7134 [Eremothecium cymbalariae DBVPG\
MTYRTARANDQRNQPHVKHSFSVGNLIGDPFAISTLSITLIAWIIALGGSIPSPQYPTFSWFAIGYQFLVMLCVLIFYLFDLIDYYRTFLASGVAVAFFYTSASLSTVLYQDKPSFAAASAGLTMLSIVDFLWMFYFGADNASPSNRWIDSFSVKGIRPSVVDSSLVLSRARKSYVDRQPALAAFYGGHEAQSQNYMSSTALNGFENADPRASNSFGMGNSGQNQIMGAFDSQGTNTYVTDTTNGNTETTMGDTLGLYSDVGDELISFPYTSRALYAYEADESDAYEISFQQGEILRVGDIEGRWWKAKRSNGETGIIPSNYVELIDDPSML